MSRSLMSMEISVFTNGNLNSHIVLIHIVHQHIRSHLSVKFTNLSLNAGTSLHFDLVSYLGEAL